ncbi:MULTISPECIES: site-specific DNA-methyltransferase [Nostocales]|uniref:Site-specific DNA-methyltransferase n=1 Tax=Dolichospermum flos-aquae UHCC 0037 TaxID=2590026 RepID=A0ACC7S4A7_DOLFA|nr:MULTISPECIES: site-specific DNA-methyltransferase [Nostocales]MBO1066658.1 site-specific DNA-methyltransferase [Anabaena sp. 54]MTJ43031.1 site-specific DNA-methyltransferase [Dolichospermum flos-aquae UHCC 0037]
MSKKQRLELTWIGKEIRPKLEPRILLEDPEKSYHAAHRVSENDIFDNRLIFGDNLLALKALEQEFTGKVKCIFIDPPYNTGSAFQHYDDGLEHSIWLGLMRDRLEILRNLLSRDGSIWITIDDNEAHYLKVMCDEIFGRANFVANVIWQKKFSPQNDAKWLSDMHDHILVFAKDKSVWRPNLLKSENVGRKRSNLDNDSRGDWISVDYTCNKNRFERPNLYYPITNPNTGEEIYPKETAVWRYNKERHQDNEQQGLVYWGKSGQNKVPRFKNFVAVDREGQVPSTIWLHQDVGNTQEARKESNIFNSDDPFATPKPERLLARIIQITTDPSDIVLDSFAGSGTTGAVAHKMGRRWIMIELGEHCHTHIIPRLKKVIDGEDKGGITQTVNWKGGGGFRYYRLAPSLLEKDKWGNWIINKEYNPAMLAEALCKIEGFTYSPSDTFYWQHGYSTERDFIYVTTQNLSHEQLSQLADEVGQERTLLVLCSAFRSKVDIFPNLTIKKIPQQILSRCEWGHDDYSLKTENLPKTPPKIEQPSPQKPQQQHIQQSLF